MSLYLEMRINSDLVETVEVTREDGENGTDLGAVYTYRWRYRHVVGTVKHRYSDGVMTLAHRVLGEIEARKRPVPNVALAVDEIHDPCGSVDV